MGSGEKFYFYWLKGLSFGFGVYVNPFPHRVSITITVGKLGVYMGFGKGYDE